MKSKENTYLVMHLSNWVVNKEKNLEKAKERTQNSTSTYSNSCSGWGSQNYEQRYIQYPNKYINNVTSSAN